MNLRLAERMAKGLLKRHSLYEWSFTWSREKRTFGRAIYTYKRITLSKAMTELNTLKNVKETILHEIAHALVGSNNGHNDIWRTMAVKIGGTGARYWDDNTRTEKIGKVVAAYSGYTKCLDCHKKTKYCFRKPKIEFRRCSTCYRQNREKGMLEWVKL